MYTFDHEAEQVLGPYAEELAMDAWEAVKSGDSQKVESVKRIIDRSADDREIDFAERNELQRRMLALLAESENSGGAGQQRQQTEQHVA